MKLPGGGRLPFREFLKRLYHEYDADNISDGAAQLGYYFLFALFPFLFFVGTVIAYLPLGNLTDQVLSRARPFLPAAAMDLVTEHLNSLLKQTRPKLLTFGLVATLWSASRGIDALRRGLNLAYDVKETRPWWKVQLIALGMTAGGTIAGLLALALLIAGSTVGFWVAGRLHLDAAYLFTMRWLRWPVVAALITLGLALGYYLLPDVKQRFKFITAGSIVATVTWLLASWGFALYVSNFGSYNATYGSIGGVIVLLTWLYLSGFIFLLGGEINAVLEHASETGKAQGARQEGEAPPPAAERPSAMPPGAAKKASIAAETKGGAA